MKIFIFLVGIGWDWGILGSNNLMNWWDINPPFMYCVFHHISDHLQRLILFWQFYKKVGIRSDPPPGWDKIPSLSKELFVRLPLGKSANVDERTWKIQNMFWEKSSTAPKQVLMYLSLVCKCERLGLTNTKQPNLQIQISAMTNTWGPTVNGHLWGMLNAYVGSSIVAITTPTEKMIGHNHFDDPKMSKSLNKSTPWQSGQVTN